MIRVACIIQIKISVAWNIYIILDGSEWDTRNIPRVRANIARIEDECNIGPNEWNISGIP